MEGHLHERVGAESMARNEVLAVALEFESLTVVLADQVADSRLCKPYASAQLRRQIPLELLRCRVDLLDRRRRLCEAGTSVRMTIAILRPSR